MPRWPLLQDPFEKVEQEQAGERRHPHRQDPLPCDLPHDPEIDGLDAPGDADTEHPTDGSVGRGYRQTEFGGHQNGGGGDKIDAKAARGGQRRDAGADGVHDAVAGHADAACDADTVKQQQQRPVSEP